LVATLLRFGVRPAADDGLGSIGLDLRNLGGRCDFRHEDVRPDAELLSGEGDGGAMVAARRRRAACRERRPGQEIVEGAAGLERAGHLKTFEFERQRRRTGDWRCDLQDRRATDVAANARMGGADVGRGHCRRCPRSVIARR